MKDINQLICKNFNRLRKKHGFTLEKLSHILGCSFQQVQKYCKGANMPSFEKCYIFAKHCDFDLTEFFKEV